MFFIFIKDVIDSMLYPASLGTPSTRKAIINNNNNFTL